MQVSLSGQESGWKSAERIWRNSWTISGTSSLNGACRDTWKFLLLRVMFSLKINSKQIFYSVKSNACVMPFNFNNKMLRVLCQKRKKVKSLSCVQLFPTPWTIAYQAPPSMGFSRQEYWSGLPFPSPIDTFKVLGSQGGRSQLYLERQRGFSFG